jgi:hypothetical protein
MTTAPAQLELLKLNHVNAIVDGYESAVDHFVGRLGFQFNLRVTAAGDDVDACLISLGPVIFELFAPRQRTERGQGRSSPCTATTTSAPSIGCPTSPPPAPRATPSTSAS